MRWKKKPYPVNGQRRIRRVWLLFRRRLNDECRWLEWAWIEQEYVSYGIYAAWIDCAWADGPAISTEPGRTWQ